MLAFPGEAHLWPFRAAGPALAALAIPERVAGALGLAVAAVRQSQPGMLATLSGQEDAFLGLLVALACLPARRTASQPGAYLIPSGSD
jgi:hypothetical protein